MFLNNDKKHQPKKYQYQLLAYLFNGKILLLKINISIIL